MSEHHAEAMRVAVLYLPIGSGHETSARALASALTKKAPQLTTYVGDPFSDSARFLPAVLDKLQAATIALAPALYDSLWRRDVSGSLFERVVELGALQELLLDLILTKGVQIVAATHVLPCALAAALKSERSVPKLVYGIVTDFGVHSYWPLAGVSGYFVGHEDVANTLVFRGIDPGNVHVTGIPIRPEIEDLPIDPVRHSDQKLRILIVAGGQRAGSYIDVEGHLGELLAALDEISKGRLNVRVVVGSNRRLGSWANRIAGDLSLDVDILGPVENMHLLIAESDVVITKPGGLIVSESLAIGVCLVLFRPGPGQEAANVEFLARHGAALRGDSPRDAARAVEMCLENPSLPFEMGRRASALGFRGSAGAAAEEILKAASTL